jgi:voltage-gated potassium channel
MPQLETNNATHAPPGLKKRLFNILESSAAGNWLGRWFDRFMIVLIVTNVLAVVLESVESLAAAAPEFFWTFELFSVAVFTIEYLARVWVCTENPESGYGHPVFGRLRQMATPMALIDLIAILPFYLAFLIPVDLRFMRVFRLLRLFKLTRYSSAMETLGAVVYGQRRPLGAALLIMLTVLVFASSIVYLFEHEAQPEAFASIPHSMWWGLATLTTVGYGDVTPITSGGRIFGAFIMVLGVGMFALPAGILANGFADEIRKREFVVSWNLVAGVPLFADLDARRIAEIAHLLRPKMVPARHAIVRRGEPAESMFFIVSGEVEVDVHPEVRTLATGDFFGEIALLKESERMATVTTVTECRLLYLDRYDFRRLLRDHPDLEDTITRVMESRLDQLEAENSTELQSTV